ncbi:MAG: hypothetical protein ACE5EM_10220 [Sphingomonadales bacterium]
MVFFAAAFAGRAEAEIRVLQSIGDWRISFIGTEKGKQVGGWCLLEQENEHDIGYDQLSIYGPQTVYLHMIGVPKVRVGVRKAVAYQVDDGPVVPIKEEWRKGKMFI